ncbi:MAG: hypothetical protein HYW49_09690 [Deltaproteobacteria bacterium]|nr:hypothetical protein [Deltaproteobacteria bacterium]
MRKSTRFAFALLSAIAISAFSPNVFSGGQTAAGLLTLALERLATTNDPKKLTDLSRAIQKFIVDPKHKKELQTEAGKDLAAVQVKLANYFALKAKFNACIADKTARLKLDTRVTDTFLKMPTQRNLTLCNTMAGQLIQSQATIEQIVIKLKQQYDLAPADRLADKQWEKARELRDDLILQGYKDALKTYLDLNHRYKRSDGKHDGRTVRQIVCELFDNPSACGSGTFHVSRLDSATYFTLQKYGENYQAQLQKITPLTTEQVRQKLNANIGVIEKAYHKVPPRPATGHLFQGEGFSESDWREYKNKGGANAWVADQLAINAKKTAARDERIQIYNQWYREYLGGMTRHPSGSLVFTEAIGAYFKAPMDYNTGEEAKFERIPSAKTVDSAVGEAMSELKKYGHFLSDRDLVKTFGYGKLSTAEIKKHVQDIVRNAPAAAAQVLVAHPEYAPLMCDAINAVNADVAKKAADDADTTKFYLWGGAIVAGGAITGGVGAAVFAGTAAGVMFATATTASFIAGTALGATSAVYYLNKANDSHREFSELKSAFISTGAKDLDAWPEMKKSFEEFEEARFQFALQVGFSAIDAASFGSVIRGFNSAQKMAAIAKAHEFLEVGRFNPVRNSRMLSIVNKLGEEEASKFFTVLSQMGKDQKYIDGFLSKAGKLSKQDLSALARKMTTDLESEKGRVSAMIEMEEFKPSGPVAEVAAKTETKAKAFLTTEDLEMLDTHDNPVWNGPEWKKEFDGLLKNNPDAAILENEVDILRTDQRYAFTEKKKFNSTRQVVTDHPGEYSTVSMIRAKDTDASFGIHPLSQEERKAYKATVKDGKLYASDGKLVDSRGFSTGHEQGADHVIFVMDKNGDIYIHGGVASGESGKPRKFFHSTLAGGGDVAAAGELKVVNGKIVAITDGSGHYEPPPWLTMQFLEQLRKRGVPLERIKIDLVSLKGK